MKKRTVAVCLSLIAVSALVGWNHFLATASRGVNRLAVIEDVNGDRIAVEPINDKVWDRLVELYHSREGMWIGGQIETFIHIAPDPNYMWGFRFTPESITVAEITAEGLQSTLRDISENLDYWLSMGRGYVFAKVAEINDSTGR